MKNTATAPLQSGNEGTSKRFHPGWAIASVASGAAMLGLAWILAAYANPFWLGIDAKNATFLSGLFVNIGTTLILAFLLVIFDGVITRKVEGVRDAAVEQASEAAKTVVDERVSGLEARISELDGVVRARSAGLAAERLAAAERVTSARYQDLEAAIRAANAINAISKASDSPIHEHASRFVVPAGLGVRSPRVHIAYDGAVESSSTITLSYADDPGKVSVVWRQGEDVVSVLIALREAFVSKGHSDIADLLQAETLFNNLREFLREAIDARQRKGETWLSGEPVHEMITSGWFVTAAGIEVVGHGVIAKRADFGHYVRGRSSASNVVTGENLPAAAPYDLPQHIFDAAVERARPRMLGRPFDAGS